MNKIIFSHEYKKHENVNLEETCRLLEVFVKEFKDMHGSFIEYDTAFSNSYKNYNLGPGKYLVLLFIDSDGIPFTTIRSYNPEKEKHYTKNRGNYFSVEVKGKLISKDQTGLGGWCGITPK